MKIGDYIKICPDYPVVPRKSINEVYRVVEADDGCGGTRFTYYNWGNPRWCIKDAIIPTKAEVGDTILIKKDYGFPFHVNSKP